MLGNLAEPGVFPARLSAEEPIVRGKLLREAKSRVKLGKKKPEKEAVALVGKVARVGKRWLG